ncbi:hypothetical protein [Corallococcus aberystwythensis]|nr:hypothetical protein [Corallococcus aberystwythensis]
MRDSMRMTGVLLLLAATPALLAASHVWAFWRLVTGLSMHHRSSNDSPRE